MKRAGHFKGRQDRFNLLDAILRAWPDAIVERDGPTGLYPFQLAVERKTFSRVDRLFADADETCLVQLSYELLKKRPDLCAVDRFDECATVGIAVGSLAL